MTIAVPNLRAVICAPGWVRSELWRRARAVPSLDLRFADSKSLVDQISGSNLITFTRSGDATYVDSDGLIKTAGTNVPRFDHNPTTGESLGLLVEEQRANLNTNSEAFDTYGLSAGSVSANQGIAPDGASTADEITSAGGGAFKSISGTTASTVYTISVFAKYISGGGLLSFGFDANPSSGRADFNLQNGALGAGVGANVISRSITPYGNGWYRCSVTATVTSTSAIIAFYSGTSGAKWLCWGAQLEAGAFSTSYIPTTTSAVTRNADVASITGANFSSWYRQDEGTVFCDAKEYPFTSTVSRDFYGLVNTSDVNNNFIRQWIWNGATGFVSNSIYTSVSGPIAADFSKAIANESKRIAVGLSINNFARAYNGTDLSTDTSGNMPSGIDAAWIGSASSSSLSLGGHIRRLTYWNQRLSNATLQAITQ